MRYLVLDTEAEALDAVAYIDARARIVFAARGYTIAADGSIVGKRASDGVDVPEAVTTTWDVPRQRPADGRWVVCHPEAHPSADVLVGPEMTVADFVMEGLDVTIEEALTNWWPSEGA
jgi:hypothetical protein